MGKERPPGRRPDDEGYADDVEIIAMTIRHGADHTKPYLHSLARLDACEAAESERQSKFAADLPKEAQAEVLPFASRGPKP